LHKGHALYAYDAADDFRGQSNPDLPVKHFAMRIGYDEHLFGFLRQVWVNRFEKGRKDWRSNKLFRSLAVAYHACSLPKRNSLWFYDVGVNLALWIGAFESLTHPGRRGRTDLPTVLHLLERAKFSDSAVKRRRRITYRRVVTTGNGAEYLYWRLYNARNAFLHGNPVTPKTALYSNPHRPSSLLSVAPLLYAVALLCFFDWFNKPTSIKKQKAGWIGIEEDFKRHFTTSRLEKSLKQIFAGNDRRLL
jgi:hypothetical protein